MRKLIHRIPLFIVAIAVIIAIPVSAASILVQKPIASDDVDQPFSPSSGTLTVEYGTNGVANRIHTTLEFSYSTTHANMIAEYNENGYYIVEGGETILMAQHAYAGVDIKAARCSGNIDNIEADHVMFTDLPNPKTDLENNDFVLDMIDDEAEVVALGTIEANKDYTFRVRWIDHRSGGNDTDGRWVVNAELSKPVLSEYNTIEYDDIVYIEYGNVMGES